MYMVMDRTDFIMTTIIAGTTIIIGRGGDIFDIDLGILGLITTNLIISDGHPIALIMYIIPTMATTTIIVIMDRITIQIKNSMWQIAGGEVLRQG